MKYNTSIKLDNKLVHCQFVAIGYNNDGYSSEPTAVALINGKLKEYNIKAFSIIEEKLMKKKNKELIKASNEFEPWDWSFMLNIIKIMVDYNYDFYKRKNVIHPDESLNKIETQLKEVKTLLDKCDDSCMNDDIIFKEAFTKFGKYMKYWWD